MHYKLIDDIALSREELERHLLSLPYWRAKLARAFKHEQGKKECTIAYELLCQMLREADLSLIGRIPERRHDRKLLRCLLGLLALPLFLACAAGSILIWLPHLIILATMEDKAWSHTVRFAVHFLFPILWPFAIVYERLLNFYRNLIEDFKRK